MKTFWEKLGTAIRHNLALTTTVLIVTGVLIWLGGCESMTRSLVTPLVKVTRSELKLEYDQEMSQLENRLQLIKTQYQERVQDLDRQDAFKQKLGEIGLTVLEGGELNPAGIAVSLMAILGVGAAVDNRIKDRIIKTKNNA